MRSVLFFSAAVFAMMTSGAWSAEKPGALRLACDGASAGAIVTINGEEKGPCPMNILVPAGPIRVHAQKDNEDISVQVFDEAFTLQPGEPRRVDIELSAPKLTEKGLALKQAEDEARRIAAEKKLKQDAMRKVGTALAERVRVDLAAADFASFRELEEGDPSFNEIFELHAVIAASRGDFAEVMSVVERGLKSGGLNIAFVAKLPKLAALLERPDFVDLIGRMAGADGAAQVRAGATLAGRLDWFNTLVASAEHRYFVGKRCDAQNNCSTWLRRRVVRAETMNYGGYPHACATRLHMGETLGANDAEPNGPMVEFMWGGWAPLNVAPYTVSQVGRDLYFSPTRDWPLSALSAPNQYWALVETEMLQAVMAACTATVAKTK
ncbi:MAG: hypothetical protein AB7H70_00075 [Rhodospirillaceae bacterium]